MVGLSSEARIVAESGHSVRAGGGFPDGAARAATALIGQGAEALISFGLAGGLDRALRPGALLVPHTVLAGDNRFSADPDIARAFGGFTGHIMLAGSTIVASPAAKRELYRITGAHAVDLESGSVARIAAERAVPFAVVRAVCDPAERSLPPAALVAVDANGAIVATRVLNSLLRRPWQIAALLRLARDAATARATLSQVIGRLRA